MGNPCQGSEAETSFRSQGTFVFLVAGKPDADIFMADRWRKADLPDSRYVWLPISFGADGPKLKWRNEWDLSFFDWDRRRADIYGNTRNVVALKLPAKVFGKAPFKSGDTIRLASSFFTHARGDRVDWQGTFTLRGPR